MNTKTRTAKTGRFPALRADYLRLIRQFPLRPIRSDTDCRQAMLVIRPLIMKGVQVDGKDDLTPGQRDYLHTMTMLIEEYERTIASPLDKELRGLELLNAMMESREMTGNQLAKVIDVSQSLVSLILAGKREISKQLARKLAGCFGLPAEAFLDI